MRQAAVSSYVTFEDYFEREASCGADAPRHEWFDGVIYAMSRGTPEHGRLTSSVTIALGTALPPDCQIYAADTMLYIPAANLATYADASVVCGPLETITVRKDGRSLGQAVTNPVVLLEVLSESTERYDRDGKFQLYKQIASLREYVLIAQDERRIEVFRREQDWHGDVAGPGEAIRIHGAIVEVDRVYRA
ncbi:MAG TPA: Uma2 family endonuclease [Kofleriaceae bacterium]|nr:Uma2 family endonuclease [Kofleriaceae bacterium]